MGARSRCDNRHECCRCYIYTPWEPVFIDVYFAEIPGTDGFLASATKTLLETLDADVVQSLRAQALSVAKSCVDSALPPYKNAIALGDI